MNHVVHVCSFEGVDLPRGRRLTYEAFRAAVIKAGRFSVFEATETQKIARMYDTLAKDPTVHLVNEQFPWTRVMQLTPPATERGDSPHE